MSDATKVSQELAELARAALATLRVLRIRLHREGIATADECAALHVAYQILDGLENGHTEVDTEGLPDDLVPF